MVDQVAEIIDPKAVNKAVRQLVRTVVVMPEKSVIPANENAPLPKTPFATVFIPDLESTGEDSLSYEEIEGDDFHLVEKLEGQRIFTASIQFFKGEAMASAHKLKSRIGLSPNLQAMQRAGLGLVDITPVRDLSAIVSSEWEQRAQLNITFHVVSVETMPVDIYDTFPVSINVDGHISTNEVKPQ